MKAPNSLRHRLFLILELKSSKDKKIALGFSWVLTLLVLSNVVSVILESVPSIHAQYMHELTSFDTISVLFFTLEYCLRIWTAAERRQHPLHTPARRRLGYMLSFHGLVDLMAILPFFLQSLLPGLDLRFFRILRVMRILKLSHYSSALGCLHLLGKRRLYFSALPFGPVDPLYCLPDLLRGARLAARQIRHHP
jgi:voltage-gated potassium channel